METLAYAELIEIDGGSSWDWNEFGNALLLGLGVTAAVLTGGAAIGLEVGTELAIVGGTALVVGAIKLLAN